MRILRLSTIAAAGLAIGFAAQLSSAQSQIEAPRVEAPRIGAPPAVAPTTAPSLAPSYAPAAPVAAAPPPAPAQAAPAAIPAIVAGPPPNVCRPTTTGDCAAEAASCLAAREISDSYHVAGEGSATRIYASRDDASQDQAEAAGDCAQDLHRCLAGGC